MCSRLRSIARLPGSLRGNLIRSLDKGGMSSWARILAHMSPMKKAHSCISPLKTFISVSSGHDDGHSVMSVWHFLCMFVCLLENVFIGRKIMWQNMFSLSLLQYCF